MYSFEDFIKEWKNDADYIEAHTSGRPGSRSAFGSPSLLWQIVRGALSAISPYLPRVISIRVWHRILSEVR